MPLPSRSPAAWRVPPVDLLIVGVLTIVVFGGSSAAAYWHGVGLGAGGYLLLLGGAVPLLYRRPAPLLAFLCSAGPVTAYYLAGYPAGPAVLLPTLGLVTLAFLRGPLVGGLAGLGTVSCVIAAFLVRGDPQGAFDPRLFGLVMWAVIAVAAGTTGRLRKSVAREGHARLVERERRRAEEERLRIAREVHDVVAHSLAMINVQAGVAAHVADRRPEQAKAALLAIKEASRTALTDLRATLDVLRSGEERAPTPGLTRLPDLIGTAAAAGITVTVEGGEHAGALPAPVDVAAYRILQESLTNVVRHAQGADRVVVRFDRMDDQLRIVVRDNGPRLAAPPGPGNGLRGMAERAGALGGGIATGAAADGGFQVTATLPLRGGGGVEQDRVEQGRDPGCAG